MQNETTKGKGWNLLIVSVSTCPAYETDTQSSIMNQSNKNQDQSDVITFHYQIQKTQIKPKIKRTQPNKKTPPPQKKNPTSSANSCFKWAKFNRNRKAVKIQIHTLHFEGIP